ncbi:MAG TPA: hypothetical protein GX739_05445 [Firmicutes bacterium]|nr:hypothetical protein [Bacillota bacterium]
MMYKNAADILPRSLVEEIQKYVQGREIYIPKQANKRLGWGERNGTKHWLNKRNQEIRQKHRDGASVEALMESYHLSYDSIRRIVRE